MHLGTKLGQNWENFPEHSQNFAVPLHSHSANGAHRCRPAPSDATALLNARAPISAWLIAQSVATDKSIQRSRSFELRHPHGWARSRSQPTKENKQRKRTKKKIKKEKPCHAMPINSHAMPSKARQKAKARPGVRKE